MSMHEYLERIRLPETLPGPFKLRLKYKLQEELFSHKQAFPWFAYSSAIAAGLMLLLSVGMILSPDWAQNINVAIFGSPALQEASQPGQQIAIQTEKQPQNSPYDLTQEEMFDQYLARESQRTWGPQTMDVSSSMETVEGLPVQITDLSQLEQGKEYIIRRVHHKDKGTIYQVTELKNSQSGRVKVLY